MARHEVKSKHQDGTSTFDLERFLPTWLTKNLGLMVSHEKVHTCPGGVLWYLFSCDTSSTLHTEAWTHTYHSPMASGFERWTSTYSRLESGSIHDIFRSLLSSFKISSLIITTWRLVLSMFMQVIGRSSKWAPTHFCTVTACASIQLISCIYVHLMSSLGAYCCCTTLHNISQQSRTKPWKKPILGEVTSTVCNTGTRVGEECYHFYVKRCLYRMSKDMLWPRVLLFSTWRGILDRDSNWYNLR